MAKRLRLSVVHKEVLMELYKRTARTVDDLPYTDEFETLYAGFVAHRRDDDPARCLESAGRLPQAEPVGSEGAKIS